MTIQERIAGGEVITGNQYNKDGMIGLKVGDTFLYNYDKCVVTEVCDGDLDGMVWIRKAQ